MIKDLFTLQGRVALVTGGSRGIGRMIAEGFLIQGAKVYISSRKTAQCDEAAEALSQDGGVCVSLPQDLSTVEGCQALSMRLAALEPKLDILVNNAGAAWGAEFEDFPESGWDKVLNLNLKSPFFLTQALYGALKAAATADRPAKVINIASIDGMRLNPQETYSYHASKSGLIYLTRRMAARLIRDNIVASCICPGAFPSEMNKAAKNAPGESSKAIPSGRVGDLEDMAGGAIYLASRAGDYVVGTPLPIDGGIVNGWIPSDFANVSGH